MKPDRLVMGAMSGTSADGVDVAIVQIMGHGQAMAATLLHHHTRPYETAVRRKIFDLRSTEKITLAAISKLAEQITLAYAGAANEALESARLSPGDIMAIAAHGQTLFHHPPHTLQWLDPSLLAHRTQCMVISDFRRADCAAGGQGAPLVPFADLILFRHPTKHRVLLNIGGIANLTHLPAGGSIDSICAFDTGPGNCISDHLMRTFNPNGGGYDAGGERALHGRPDVRFARAFMGRPYFGRQAPKSTDAPQMLACYRSVAADHPISSLENALATACLITARTIADAIDHLIPRPQEVIVSGGGTENRALMQLLRAELAERHSPAIALLTTDQLHIPSAAKEAVSFALLGAATLDDLPSNVPACTGASRPVVLGSITPRPYGKAAASPSSAANQAKSRLPNEIDLMRPSDRSKLLTEQRLDDSMHLDEMTLPQAAALMSQQDRQAVESVEAERGNIVCAIELIVSALRAGGRLLYVGAGTSGRLGVLDASECPPTFCTDPDRVRAIIAGGPQAVFKSREGAEDDAEQGASEMDRCHAGPDDVVCGIAAGGTTPFVHGALRRAASLGAATIFITCVQPVSNEPAVNVTIRPLVGPEVLTGSTRLKAGTATKLILNTLSTLAMVRLGKVHENLMVDLRITNAKLRDRAERIVMMLTTLDRPAAAELLHRADHHIKSAVVMHHRGVDLSGAKAILRQCDDLLRAALKS